MFPKAAILFLALAAFANATPSPRGLDEDLIARGLPYEPKPKPSVMSISHILNPAPKAPGKRFNDELIPRGLPYEPKPKPSVMSISHILNPAPKTPGKRFNDAVNLEARNNKRGLRDSIKRTFHSHHMVRAGGA